MSILVVDPDQIFQETVINLLLICGVKRFAVVSSGKEAKEKISKSFFDIILINLFMPDINGLQLAGDFQQHKPDTKIILIIEDHKLPSLNKAEQANLNFPTILKSGVNRMLLQLLSEEG